MKVSEDKYVSEDGKRVFERIPGTKYFTLNGLGKFIIPKGCTNVFRRVSARTPAEERAFYDSNDNIVSTNVHRAPYKPQSDKNEQ